MGWSEGEGEKVQRWRVGDVSAPKLKNLKSNQKSTPKKNKKIITITKIKNHHKS